MAAGYNEGKAIDAVLRYIATRDQTVRQSDGRSPDDLNDPDPLRRVDYVCTVGGSRRLPHEVRRYFASFGYQAQSWNKSCRVVAKVEWHPSELYPRVAFIVTNLARPAVRAVAFYNQRATAEQWIKEGKGAIKCTRLRWTPDFETGRASLERGPFRRARWSG